MIVLGRVQKLRRVGSPQEPALAIRVESYHRGHLSLRPGTQVFLALYPGDDRRNSAGSMGKFPEMMGTTIHKDSWRYVFRISLTLKDRAGVVHQVLESVAAHGGNVLYLDSSSIEQERYHQVEAIVDFRPLVARLRSVPADESEALIRGILLADCYNVIASQDGRPKVAVSVMRSLRRMDLALSVIANPQTLIAICEVGEKGDLALPSALIEDVNYEMQRSFPGHPLIAEGTKYLLTSDTKERTFHVHVLSERQLVVWCAIRHDDRPGALAAITDSLRGEQITILTSLNRLEAHLQQSWFEAVLACDRWIRAGTDAVDDRQKEIELEVQRILHEKVPVHFGWQVYFNQRAADDRVREKRAPPPNTPLRNQRKPVLVGEWLEGRNTLLKEVDAKRDDRSEHDDHMLFHAPLDDRTDRNDRRTLAEGVAEVIRITRLRPRRLFLSIAHIAQNDDLVDVVRDVCHQNQFYCDVVTSTERSMGVRAEVRRRIEDCTHFLGVWTHSRWDSGTDESGRFRVERRRGPDTAEGEPSKRNGADEVVDERLPRPSPWCLWEIAVAEVLGRTIRVAIQDGMSRADYEALYSAEFAFRFVRDRGLSDFARQVEKALRSL